MAHVALLQTLIHAVFRFRPKTCMNSPGTETTDWWNGLGTGSLTHKGLDVLEAGLGEVSKESK